MGWFGLNSCGSGKGHEGDKWHAVANTVMNNQCPQNAANSLTCSGTIIFSVLLVMRFESRLNW